jgi:hypothetical protein
MSELQSNNNVRFRERVALLASLGLYIALLAATIPRHQPWADEAQAWQIARSNSFIELFRTAIHYEFSPGLWHALLWVLVRLHIGYAGLPWITGAIALSGLYLVLFASPLPLALRLLLPFTYFFAFQYAVVARSYVLFAPLLFLLATIWNRRERHPILTALLLGLLANVSAHGLVTAVGLVAVIAIEQWKMRSETSISTSRWVIAATIVTTFIAFAIWCMIPPRDADWLLRITTAVHLPAATVFKRATDGRHPLRGVPPFLRLPLGLLVRFLYVLGFGVAKPKSIALVGWLLLLWRWRWEKRMRYVIPIALLGGLCTISRFDTYHAGLVWVLLLFLWWVTWPDNNRDPRQRSLIVVFSFCIACQLWWTLQAMRYEMTEAYSPDLAAATILRRYLDKGKQVDVAIPPPSLRAYGEYLAIGLEPYFAVEPFHDEESRYWIWRPHPAMYARYLRDTETRSVVVMVEQISNDSRISGEEQRLLSLGYRKEAAVCGRVFYPLQDYPELCHVFYVPGWQ